MKRLRHENLVKLWGVCTLEEPLLIVAEFMINGSLLSYLREGHGRYLLFKEAIDISAQIANGMKYLESSKCVHRD
jgi:serine/threonine protein kinase